MPLLVCLGILTTSLPEGKHYLPGATTRPTPAEHLAERIRRELPYGTQRCVVLRWLDAQNIRRPSAVFISDDPAQFTVVISRTHPRILLLFRFDSDDKLIRFAWLAGP